MPVSRQILMQVALQDIGQLTDIEAGAVDAGSWDGIRYCHAAD
jgi:hypothetical protein